MKLSEVIDQLDIYEKNWGFNRILFGDSQAVVNIRNFLRTCENKHNSEYTFDILKKILKLTNQKRLTTNALLKYLTDNNDSYHNIFGALSNLDKLNILNKDILASIIKLNPEQLYDLEEFISILTQEKTDIVIDNKCVLRLLNEDATFFIDKKRILATLKNHGLLCQETFDYICNNHLYPLSEILIILSRSDILNKNYVLLDKLVGHKDIDSLFLLIKFMGKNEFINTSSLDNAINLTNKMANNLFEYDITDLIGSLEQSNIQLTNNEFDQLLAMSTRNFHRLSTIIDTLTAKNLINHDSFSTALLRVTRKIPAPDEAKVVISHADSQKGPLLVITPDNNAPCIYVSESGTFLSGGYGEVKKGYPEPTANSPVFAVKKLINDKDGFTRAQVARREVKYNQLLGRNSFFYKDNTDYFVVYNWQKGKSLASLSNDAIKIIPLIKRLKALTHGIADINTLHENYRIHGDIKTDNFIFDIPGNKLKLIDFGSCHKQGTSKSFESTHDYADHRIKGDYFSRDIFSLGLVTAELFPELFPVSFTSHQHVQLHGSFCTPLETAIMLLVVSMIHASADQRCTSKDALDFCNYIIKNHNTLNMQSVNKIALETIQHSSTTLEDALRHAPKWG